MLLTDTLTIKKHVAVLLDNVLIGVIDQGAYNLGMHVLSAMSRLGVNQVALVPKSFKDTAIRDVTTVAGPFRPETAKQFAQALQLLHFRAGILNSNVESDLDDPERHFTLHVNNAYQRTWGEQTPIIFRRGGNISVYPGDKFVRFGC